MATSPQITQILENLSRIVSSDGQRLMDWLANGGTMADAINVARAPGADADALDALNVATQFAAAAANLLAVSGGPAAVALAISANTRAMSTQYAVLMRDVNDPSKSSVAVARGDLSRRFDYGFR